MKHRGQGVWSRVMSLLLVLCMTVGVLPGFAATARAVDITDTYETFTAADLSETGWHVNVGSSGKHTYSVANGQITQTVLTTSAYASIVLDKSAKRVVKSISVDMYVSGTNGTGNGFMGIVFGHNGEASAKYGYSAYDNYSNWRGFVLQYRSSSDGNTGAFNLHYDTVGEKVETGVKSGETFEGNGLNTKISVKMEISDDFSKIYAYEDGTLQRTFELDEAQQALLKTEGYVGFQFDRAAGSFTNYSVTYQGSDSGLTLDADTVALERTAAAPVATKQLTATTAGLEGTVVWTSSNSDVAAVDQTGLVTAVGAGTATVTAAVGGVSASCQVTVTRDMALMPLTATEKAAIADLTESVLSSGNNLKAAASGVYSAVGIDLSDYVDQNIAGMCNELLNNSNGYTAKIAKNKYTMMLLPKAYNGYVITEDMLQVGDIFCGTKACSGGTKNHYQTAVYQGDGAFLSVVSNCDAGCDKNPQTQVALSALTAESNSWTYYFVLRPSHIATGAFLPQLLDFSMDIAESKTLSLSYATLDGENVADNAVTWFSSNPAVATVDASSGEVTAVGSGTAVITAQYGENTVSCTVTVSKLYSFLGSNIDLGNSLDMNFYISKDAVDAEGYAVVTKDGTPVTVSLKENNSYWQITYRGLAAKEMNTPLTVVVYDKDGNAVSVAREESIRDYCERTLGKSAAELDVTDAVLAKIRTMLVDMLNYGAAAQTYFNYNADELANSGLTEEQKTWASESVTLTKERTAEGDAYYGTNLDLESNISVNVYVLSAAFGDAGYAKITYTDHLGNEKEIQISAADCATSGDYTVVNISSLAVADARQDITVTCYDSSDNAFATVTDSMEAYVNRNQDDYAWMISIMKFADASYAYLHSENQ